MSLNYHHRWALIHPLTGELRLRWVVAIFAFTLAAGYLGRLDYEDARKAECETGPQRKGVIARYNPGLDVCERQLQALPADELPLTPN
jgi:hypothetical protein